LDEFQRLRLLLLNRHFHCVFGFGEKGLGFLAGCVGLADLGDDELGGFVGDPGNGEFEEVALGDGGVETGAGVEIHQFADDGQAQVGVWVGNGGREPPLPSFYQIVGGWEVINRKKCEIVSKHWK
jgi:hypothetical protein